MAQKYKLIYCARINDDKHHGMLKVGDTEFTPTKPVNSYAPDEPALQHEANARIRSWSGTAAAGAELVYCEALIRYNENTQNNETYRDSEVHSVLQQAGFPKVDFDSANDCGREWFKVDLDTVKAAIKATKEFRTYLDTSELPTKDIYGLREEQAAAVKMTKARFEKKRDMLWHAKMRFGKTITALNLVKDMGFKRTIIITHRPVVEDSWGSDFYHVFAGEDKYAFLTKIHDAEYVLDDDETNETADKANDARLTQLVKEDQSFVYFASIQDLRGSKIVGGRFQKNNIVFETDWDLVIIDEAHEGTKTSLGQKVIDCLIKKNTKRLDLSGTAYNLFDRYTEKGSVYTWDYVMEQEAKRKWPETHPGEKNPYEDMPVMHINTFDLERAIKEKGIDLAGKSFSFREFFRTWTGDLSKDGQPIPDGREIGDFVHPEAVRRFLDLLSINEECSKFPYVTKDGIAQNAHSLWMVPGVREAAALSKMLKNHPWFGQEALFGIANVAGEGDHDEEKNYGNALALVRKTIENHPCSITLSCGRLTTGVTVKEWSSVFMLSGSDSTDAKAYMQTIFRVQSAGKINGVQKRDAYVYDFAPDRTLLVIAASVVGARRGRTGTVVDDDDQHEAFEDFLEFCPVIAIDGAEFKPFSVESLVSQINRVQIDRALKTGFMDNGIYDISKFRSLQKDDIDKMNAIFQKLKETKDKSPLTSAGMADNGIEQGKTGNKSEKKDDGKKSKGKDKDPKELEKNILEKLRTISIRIPLLFYGGNFEIEEGRLGKIITGIDQASWDVFMPQNLTKKDFLELVKYYNQQTVIGAGRIIRDKAKKADEMTPTERVIAITDIFSHFHNPSKETVLTPWRVVNMHLSDTLGGWCFYNEQFEENTDEYYNRLLQPRFVDRGVPTSNTFSNPDAQILEINSKSGLYPLYAAYSLYRAKLGDKEESDFLPEELLQFWDEAVSQIYVLCQTPMAMDITNRTLVGYRSANTNVKYNKKLLDKLKASVEKPAKEMKKGSYWGKEVKEMRFDAIVGNPPYQEMDGGGKGYSAKPVYNYFIDAAKTISPRYISMITPSRWFSGGKGLDDFRDSSLQDSRMREIVDYVDNEMLFSGVAIVGGVNYFLWDRAYSGDCKFTSVRGNHRSVMTRSLNEYDVLVRNNESVQLIRRIQEDSSPKMDSVVFARNVFGIPSDFRGKETPDEEYTIKMYCSEKSNNMTFTYIKDKDVVKEKELIAKYKVIIGKVVPRGGEVGVDPKIGYRAISTVQVLYPNSAFTDTYLLLAAFDSENEAVNFAKYMTLRFPRFLLHETYSSMNISKGNFRFVPYLDYSIQWSDQQLYEKYKCTEDEIEMINALMRPLEFVVHKETGAEKQSLYEEV